MYLSKPDAVEEVNGKRLEIMGNGEEHKKVCNEFFSQFTSSEFISKTSTKKGVSSKDEKLRDFTFLLLLPSRRKTSKN